MNITQFHSCLLLWYYLPFQQNTLQTNWWQNNLSFFYQDKNIRVTNLLLKVFHTELVLRICLLETLSVLTIVLIFRSCHSQEYWGCFPFETPCVVFSYSYSSMIHYEHKKYKCHWWIFSYLIYIWIVLKKGMFFVNEWFTKIESKRQYPPYFKLISLSPY